MEQIQKHRKLTMFLLNGINWAALTVIFGWVWYRFYALSEEIGYQPLFYRRGNWVVIGVYGILLFFITQFYGGYRVGYYKRGDVLFSSMLSVLFTNFLSYWQVSLINRAMVAVMPIVWMTVVHMALIWIWASIASKIYLKLNPPRQLLMVYGSNAQAQSLIVKMLNRDDKYLIREAVNIDEGLWGVLERVKGFDGVVICDVKSTQRNRLLKYCYHLGIRVYMTPKISDILVRGAEGIHLFDSPLLLSRNNGLSPTQSGLKRVMDIVLAGIALIVASPIMLVVAAAIKLGDGGPALFRQTRLTINGREFSLYKFRSMIQDAESKTGARLAAEGDSRITPVGAVLRKYRLDELPQLWNILRGDMSVVGPRPERPEIAAQYRTTMEEFDFRLKVKAGLTGNAQVLGKYNTTPYDKLKLDLMYIANYSLLLDVKLILMTIKTLFQKESTEGLEEGQRTAGDRKES